MQAAPFIPLPLLPEPASAPTRQWDIFCKVIDNYGDAGVCWRLASSLAQRGQQVRLWIDDPDCLRWMAPNGLPGVEICPWTSTLDARGLPRAAGDVLVEAFGCTLEDGIAAWWSAAHPLDGKPHGLWLNLEYLSAESYVARCHGLQSPVMHGPAAGHSKQFFYPGFTPDTGGLLREADLPARQQRFARAADKTAPDAASDALRISLFCYEPAALPNLLQQLHAQPSLLRIMQGRGRQKLQRLLGTRALPLHHGACRLDALPWLDQSGFDEVLWSCDLNFVRGEDSLVRALWAGQPFVWHIYPQDDDAHHAKLEAFLDWLQAPADLRAMHDSWNGLTRQPLPKLTADRLLHWQDCVQAARTRLLQQDDLTTQLLQWAARDCRLR